MADNIFTRMRDTLTGKGQQQPQSEQRVVYGSQENEQRNAPVGAYGKIGKKEIGEAQSILDRYKAEKGLLEKRIIENNEWWELRNWSVINGSGNETDPKPASAWLFNMLANKHADAMDNRPDVSVLPREKSDEATAQVLSEVMPVILERNNFVDVYSDEWWQKLKIPAGVYGVFWDKNAADGLGDISIKSIDLLNLFWQPGIKDIQSSPHFFHVTKVQNEILSTQYPQLKGRTGGGSFLLAEYNTAIYGKPNDRDKSTVVDWYYKVCEKITVAEGIETTVTRLHYCKYCNGVVLYASENDPQYAKSGYYAHGMYPYHFDPVFPIPNSPVGFCYVDVAKEVQEQIDKLDQVIMKNAIASCRKRLIYNENAGINVEDLADYTKDFIPSTLSGHNFKDAFYEIENKPLAGIYLNILMNKVQELKETTGNRDVAQGGTSGGVTAASGIAAQQEASGKLSRDMIDATYRVYARVCKMCIELIRQFYDFPRTFRIVGERGVVKYMDVSKEMLAVQEIPDALTGSMKMRKPDFDIKVRTHKANPYSRAAQEERFLTMFRSGFFNPELADQALL